MLSISIFIDGKRMNKERIKKLTIVHTDAFEDELYRTVHKSWQEKRWDTDFGWIHWIDRRWLSRRQKQVRDLQQAVLPEKSVVSRRISPRHLWLYWLKRWRYQPLNTKESITDDDRWDWKANHFYGTAERHLGSSFQFACDWSKITLPLPKNKWELLCKITSTHTSPCEKCRSPTDRLAPLTNTGK